MNKYIIFIWIIFIVGGFFLGGIMFSYLLPKQILKKDIYKISSDGNPGSANVFINCGIPLGFLCLFLDMFKCFIPVFIVGKILNTHNICFAFVITAPVLGHAVAPYNHFHGGKCIASSFGGMIALLPITPIVFLLAGLYIFFSIIIKINPNSKRSIVTFSLFGIISSVIFLLTMRYSLALGCIMISAIVVRQHIKQSCSFIKFNR